MVKNAAIKWILGIGLFLFPLTVLAVDSLRVTCSEDGFLLNATSTVAKSFTIDAGSSSNTLVDATLIADNVGLGLNYGASTTGRIGINLGTTWKWLLRFNSMNDSMIARAAAATGVVTWDSARITLVVHAAPTAGDTIQIKAFELKSTRAFGEGTQTGALGLGASWWDYDSTSGVQNLWTTAGAGSGTSDYDNSVALADYLVYAGNSSAGTDHVLSITAANTVSDTFNNAGLVIFATDYGDDDGTTSVITYRLDDYTTDNTDRPKITVYYHETYYNNYGGADSIRCSGSIKPIWKFDISSLPTGQVLDSCKFWGYVQTAAYTANTGIGQIMKPIFMGDNAGTAADAGEMSWVSWYESGNDDSTWGTAGMGNQGTTCNRSDGSGNDYRNNSDGFTAIAFDATGWKSQKFDTLFVYNYLYTDACTDNGFGLTVLDRDGEGDPDLVFEAKEKAASSNDAFIVIYYTAVATTSKGTGRFGRDSQGIYRNVR